MVRAPGTLVVALGGNALVRPGERPTAESQARNATRAMHAVVELVRRGHRIVLTHGNGFQVGSILIRVQRSLGAAYALPLHLCVAESQGEIGLWIEQALQNELRRGGMRRAVVGLLTQVQVDARDPAFARPSKPVGPWLSAGAARRLRRAGHTVAHERGRGWRRVVASPRPLAVDDSAVLRLLLRRGVIVIAAGGGGVPVVRTRSGDLRGVAAVIDKDFAAAVLARDVGATGLVILTGEPCVYRDYRRSGQRRLAHLGVAEARRLLGEGQFPPGSMGPKIEAAIGFLEHGGRHVLITAARTLAAALAGRAGTVLTRAGRPTRRAPRARSRA